MTELLHSNRHTYMARLEHDIWYHAFMVRREHSGDGEISSVDSSDSSISTRAFTHHVASPIDIDGPTLDGHPRNPSDLLTKAFRDSSRDSPINRVHKLPLYYLYQNIALIRS